MPSRQKADTPRADTPLARHPPSATVADGTHPTGILSCGKFFHKNLVKLKEFGPLGVNAIDRLGSIQTK